jgi:hypothetical protein
VTPLPRSPTRQRARLADAYTCKKASAPHRGFFLYLNYQISPLANNFVKPPVPITIF